MNNPQALSDLLSLVSVTATPEQIEAWDARQRGLAADWASAVHLNASDNYVPIPPKPPFLVDLDAGETVKGQVAHPTRVDLGEAFRTIGKKIKSLDPNHDKTVVNGAGGRQSRLDFAVGSADPFATLAQAKIQAEGDTKYGKDNWRLISEEDHIAHALTHLTLHLAGDNDEAHLAHALTRVHMAMAKYIRPDFYGDWSPEDGD